MDIVALEKTLWEYVRKHQARGGLVRSSQMAYMFGSRVLHGRRVGGGYFTPYVSGEVGCACLVGTLGDDEEVVTSERAAEVLGIHRKEALILEAGFENRDGLLETPDLSGDALRAHPLYMLGRSIAAVLEKEEEDFFRGQG